MHCDLSVARALRGCESDGGGWEPRLCDGGGETGSSGPAASRVVSEQEYDDLLMGLTSDQAAAALDLHGENCLDPASKPGPAAWSRRGAAAQRFSDSPISRPSGSPSPALSLDAARLPPLDRGGPSAPGPGASPSSSSTAAAGAGERSAGGKAGMQGGAGAGSGGGLTLGVGVGGVVRAALRPSVVLLCGCAALGLAKAIGTGDAKVFASVLALVVAAFPLFVAAILAQRSPKCRALDIVEGLWPDRAVVVRDGVHKFISARQIVPGDLVRLQERDIVPADGILIVARDLQIDESLLVQPHLPVRICKRACAPRTSPSSMPSESFESYTCFAGTVVVSGRGYFTVTATGADTHLAQISAAIHYNQQLPATEPVRGAARNTATQATLLAALVSSIAFIALGVNTGDWSTAALNAASLALTIIPGEMELVLLVFSFICAWRAHRHGISSNSHKVLEALGRCGVVCMDYTGTVTLGTRFIRSLYTINDAFHFRNDLFSLEDHLSNTERIPDTFHELIEYALLCGHRTPSEPFECAVKRLVANRNIDSSHVHNDWSLIREYVPTPGRPWLVGRVWSSVENLESFSLAVAGAPESIFPLCPNQERQIASVSLIVEDMISNGVDPVVIAKSSLKRSPHLPYSLTDIRMQLLGVIGLVDPYRASLSYTVKSLIEAGTKVIIMTDQDLQTAQKICGQVIPPDHLLLQEDLNELVVDASTFGEFSDSKDLALGLSTAAVIANAGFQQKNDVVHALRSVGNLVCVVGDTVCDAPAIVASHCGVALGGGDLISRDAAGLILVRNSMADFTYVVSLSRRLYANSRRAASFLTAMHVAIFGVVIAPLCGGAMTVDSELGEILKPIHIAFLQIFIASVCALALEGSPEEFQLRGKKIVSSNTDKKGLPSLLSTASFSAALLQGIGLLAHSLLCYWCAKTIFQQTETVCDAMVLGAIAVGLLVLVVSNRTWTKPVCFEVLRRGRQHLLLTPIWWLAVATVGVFVGVVLYCPGIRDIFGYTGKAVDITGVALFIGFGVTSSLWFECVKLLLWVLFATCGPSLFGNQFRHHRLGSSGEAESGTTSTGDVEMQTRVHSSPTLHMPTHTTAASNSIEATGLLS
ncbi:cation transport ATPase [Pelomyxa schiedti]|nr:cation transport ATPase [Pelomyxa schiedti]